jgi:hypothetical protein
MRTRVFAAFVAAICLALIVVGLGHLVWYLGLGVLVIAGAVLGVYLTQPKSTNISIRTSGASQVDISINGGGYASTRGGPLPKVASGPALGGGSVFDQPPMQYSRPLCICGAGGTHHASWCKARWPERRMICRDCEYDVLTSDYGEVIKRVPSRPCPRHTARFAAPGSVPVVDAADPEAELSAPIYNDIPGLLGYVQRDGQLQPIMDPDHRGSPSIFPRRPGGNVEPFPGPYAPDSDVIKWAEDRGEREWREQQRRDGYAG